MRVWIDLSNSPHPLLFAPLARGLVALDHEVLVTARDNAQTAALARERFGDVDIIGGASPGPLAGKALAIGSRIAELRRWAKTRRPDVAVSHNSYAQIVAAWSLRVPTVTAMDYEHQPANHLAFRLASRILLPDIFPADAMRRFGARATKVRRYPGLKELVYLGDFKPDDHVLDSLGLSRDPSRPLVVARTPPTGALYHRHGNSLFFESLRALIAQPDLRCVVLPRTADQRGPLARDLPTAIIPDRVVDARSLVHASDLFLGAGGTMTREAALFAIPTFTVFAGAPAAADVWLQEQGLLKRLTSPDDLIPVRRRPSEPRSVAELGAEGAKLLARFTETVIEAASGTPLRPSS
jgi:uncharacterized protein